MNHFLLPIHRPLTVQTSLFFPVYVKKRAEEMNGAKILTMRMNLTASEPLASPSSPLPLSSCGTSAQEGLVMK
jgi:hypothetical protein